MGVNTKIQLPLHVRGDYVLQVIGKVVGEPWTKGTFGKDKSVRIDGRWRTVKEPLAFDPDQPPSRANPWHVRFENPNMKVQPSDFTHSLATMIFTDASGAHHGWYWHTEDENERFKQLTPGAHALAVAVGRRLVAFFGGQIIYNDTNDKINYKVAVSKARFPKMKPSQTSNDRWDQFHGLLAEEPMLTAAELRKAIARMGTRPCDEQLLAKLEVLESAEQLDEALPTADAQAKRNTPRL